MHNLTNKETLLTADYRFSCCPCYALTYYACVCVCLVCVCAASLFPCSFSASAEQKAASSSCSRWIHKTMPSEANGLMTLRFWISLLPPPSHTHTYSYTSTKSTRRGDSPKQKGHKFELVFFLYFSGSFSGSSSL